MCLGFMRSLPWKAEMESAGCYYCADDKAADGKVGRLHWGCEEKCGWQMHLTETTRLGTRDRSVRTLFRQF